MPKSLTALCLVACVSLAACAGDSGGNGKDQGVEGLTFVDLWPPQPDLVPHFDSSKPPDGQPPVPDGPTPPPPDGQPPSPDGQPPLPDQGGPPCSNDADCDDGLACTANKCVGGACQNTVNPNFCAIAGQCVAIDAINPNDTCKKCQPTEDAWAWSPYVCTTLVAGTGNAGLTDGTTSIARFYYPAGVAVGPSGEVYVADSYNHRIRMIAGGNVTTLAGSTAGFADGAAATAKFNLPFGVAVGPGGEVYVADYNNHRIRVIENGQVSTHAGATAGYLDGLSATARFNNPMDVAVGPSGEVYVADTNNHRIRMITGGQVSTLAGNGGGFADGTTAQAKFSSPSGLTVTAGGEVYVADRNNHRVRLIKNGQVTTIAGNGTAALLYYPADVAVDGAGAVYIADEYHHRIRTIQGGQLVDFAGSGTAGYQDSPNLDVRFNRPWGLALTGNTMYVGDRYNHRVRKVSW